MEEAPVINENAEFLWQAARAGEINTLRHLLSPGLNPDRFLKAFYRTRWGGMLQTALYAAAEREGLSLESFLRFSDTFRADPAAMSPMETWDFNPLHLATVSGDIEAVRTLLEDGADVNAKFSTPYWSGPAVLLVLGEQPDQSVNRVDQRHIDLIELFLDRGADVNASFDMTDYAIDQDDDPLLRIGDLMTQAVRLESLDLVKVLVRRGAELYSSLLEQAFGYNESPALMEYLVREQGLGKDDPKELFTMVTYLDGPCRAKKVRLLLEGQVGLDAQYICDALAEECRVMRDPGVVATLLEQGVDVNMPAHDGWTALYSAVTIGPDHGSFLSIIRALLDRGADPNIFCDSKKRLLDKRLVDTALHECIYNYDRELSPAVIEMLLNAGADLNARDSLGYTPLLLVAGGLRDDYISDTGKAAAARMLIDAGADIHARDNSGGTALHYLFFETYSRNVLTIVAMILWRGGRPDAVDDYGKKPTDYWNTMGGWVDAMRRWRAQLPRSIKAADAQHGLGDGEDMAEDGKVPEEDVSDLVASYYSLMVSRSTARRPRRAGDGNGGRVVA